MSLVDTAMSTPACIYGFKPCESEGEGERQRQGEVGSKMRMYPCFLECISIIYNIFYIIYIFICL